VELFSVFKNFYLFIPQFLEEHLTMSHGALAGKHCSIISDVECLVDDEWERTSKEGTVA